jgi:predicted ATPase
LKRAIETARLQAARTFELRASTRLARLWRDQGKPARARELLAPIRGSFTEDFDMREVREACDLLGELG